jgi:hypothetical protein
MTAEQPLVTREHRPAIVTLADGQPAWARNRRVTQSDINQYGSRANALAAREGKFA